MAAAEENKSVECGFCCRRNEALEEPKTLPCGHAHCFGCLSDALEAIHMVQCPLSICGEVFDVTLASLPSYDMEGGDVMCCDVCVKKGKGNQKADGYCSPCDKKFCTKHLEYHDEVMENHKTISIETYKTQGTRLQKRMCEEHKDQPYNAGCKKCLKVICVDCLSGLGSCADGGNHELMALEEFVKVLKKEINDLKGKMMDKEETFCELFKFTSKKISEYDDATKEMVQLLHQTRKEQMEALKEKYRKLEEELMQARLKVRADMIEFLDINVGANWSALRNHRQKIDSRHKHSHQCDIVCGYKVTKDEIQKLIDLLPTLNIPRCTSLSTRDMCRDIELDVLFVEGVQIDSQLVQTSPNSPPKSLNLLNTKKVDTSNGKIGWTCAEIAEPKGKYVEVEGEGDHIHFEPVIELPDLVDVKTGEEDETELYVHRAKLYRFTNGEFKERGLGDVKILKHKMTDKVRIILRREKVLKLACNHIITENMNLRAMENAAGKAWIWYAMDFAEGAGSEELFAIRFKTAEIAEEFKACFDAAKKNEQVPEQKLKTVTPQKSRSRAASESNSANRSRPPSESHSGTPVKPSTSKSQADTTTTTPASGTSLFGHLNACSPANPRSQSAATNLFGTHSTPAAVFGSISAPMQATSYNKPLYSMVAKSDEGQESVVSTTVVSTSAADSGKSKIPVPATKSTPDTTAVSEEQTTASTPSRSMIPVVNGKSTPGSSAQPLLALPKLDAPKTGSIFGGKALFGQPGSTSASPSANNNGSTSIFGAKPTSQSLFGGAGARSSPQSVFGGATSSPQAVFDGAKASPQSVFGGATSSPQAVFGGAGATNSPQSSGTPTNRSVFAGCGAGSMANGDSDVEFVCENRPREELVRKAKEFLLPSGYYMYEERRGCHGCIGCESNEDAILDHLFHNKSYTKQPGLSLACKSTKTPSSKAVVGKSDGDDGLFTDFKTTIDFSSAGAANNSNAFQKTEGFKWSGAGSTLFGGYSGASKQDEANAYFKPVLDMLPEVIEVKTGEEDEERIFRNRAKLYRFDVSANQWKERGVGEMNLLKHHEKGTVRVLLRREQVHKLVCNHLVQPDLELRPMATSETAWCWFAKDYSDNSSEDPAVEQFAVRFNNIELAKEFKQRFEESKVFVREALETRANQADHCLR